MKQILERCETGNSTIWSNIVIELLLTISGVENSNGWDDPLKADVQGF